MCRNVSGLYYWTFWLKRIYATDILAYPCVKAISSCWSDFLCTLLEGFVRVTKCFWTLPCDWKGRTLVLKAYQRTLASKLRLWSGLSDFLYSTKVRQAFYEIGDTNKIGYEINGKGSVWFLSWFHNLRLSRLERKVSSLSSGNDESSEMTDPDSLAALMESLKYQQEVVELERKVSLHNEWMLH